MSACVCEKEKINSFEITVIIFKAYKKCKSHIQKGLQMCGTPKQNILEKMAKKTKKTLKLYVQE